MPQSTDCDLLANLHIQAEAEAAPRISFHGLEHCMEEVSPIVGYHCYDGLPSPSLESKKDVDGKHIKAMIKGHKVVVQVADCFNHGGTGESASLVQMDTGGCGLIGGLPHSDEEKEQRSAGGGGLHDATLWFENTCFHHHHHRSPKTGEGDGRTSTHCLHFSAPNQLRNVDNNSITLITGLCLFSGGIMTSSTEQGIGINSNNLESAKPTLYEVDAIARTAPVVVDWPFYSYYRHNRPE